MSPATLPITPAAAAERPGQVGDAAAVGVPRQGRLGQAQLLRPGVRPRSGRWVRGRRACRPRRRAVPASCCSRIRVSRSTTPSTAVNQPAATRPNVVGRACWSRVRAATRCPGARRGQGGQAVGGRCQVAHQRPERAAGDQHRARSPGCPGSSRRGGRAVAAGPVSDGAQRPRAGGRPGFRWRRPRPRAGRGVEAGPAPTRRGDRSAATWGGISPSPAWARASAASTSSSAWSHARSVTSAATGPAASTPSKSPVPPHPLGSRSLRSAVVVRSRRRRSHRRPAGGCRTGSRRPSGSAIRVSRRWCSGRDRSTGSRSLAVGLVAEVDPGDHPVQQASGEDRHVDVRCLEGPLRRRHRTRLAGQDGVPTLVVVGHRPKPRKPGTAPRGSSGWLKRAERVGLPGLHQRVADRVAVAVGDPAAQPEQRPGCPPRPRTGRRATTARWTGTGRPSGPG